MRIRTTDAALSPDSRWLAYVSDEQDANEVFVRPFPDGNGGKWQVSSGGGSAPLWAHNGRELFYVANAKMSVMRIPAPCSRSGRSPRGSPIAGTFAITPDDQRFSWCETTGGRTWRERLRSW